MKRILTATKGAGRLYVYSWLFLLWSAICLCGGAAWMFIAIASVLKARGLL